jgi:hypothetical protein
MDAFLARAGWWLPFWHSNAIVVLVLRETVLVLVIE